MRILYVEDNQHEAALVSRYLRTTAHDLIVANDLHQARQAMGNEFDLVLVDVVLERDRSGYEFIRELREGGFNRPIIAVTGLATAKDMDECRQTGVDDILNKPFTINQLAGMISQYS